MKQRTLGSTGTLVSDLCLGVMTFGDETPEDDAHRILDRYVDAGGTFLDLADVYAGGESERIVGRWLAKRGHHDDLVLATKARFPTGPGPNDQGLSAAYLHRAIEASLGRMGVDHVDLYQVHAWDPLTPVEETLTALDDLVRSGKVRHVGVSNLTGWQLERYLMTARELGVAVPVTLQPQWNLLAREIEWELVPLCEDEGVGILPWSPLGGGWLTGKYSREERPTGDTRLGDDPERGVEAYDKRNTERTWRILDVVREIAEERGVPMEQVALNWLRAQPTVSSVILGVRTLEQLESNLGAATWELADDEVERLTEVSDPGMPDYPYGMIRDASERRLGTLD